MSRINLKKPQMFRDEPAELRLEKAKHISDLKNLGPATEAHFKKAGISSVANFKKLGWQKTMEKLVKSNPKNRHSLFAYALIGALKNIDWNRISDSDKLMARQFCASLKKTKSKK